MARILTLDLSWPSPLFILSARFFLTQQSRAGQLGPPVLVWLIFTGAELIAGRNAITQ